jgi:hypothetical protein
MKFTEGEEYEFTVLKIVDLPEEGEFYLLRHSSGRRLMLSYSTYKNYGIEPDQTILCRVDKVNCTGKVYLEPKHPYYLEGSEYRFEIIEIRSNPDNTDEPWVIVLDYFKNHVKVLWPKSYALPTEKNISLLVDRVKKGIPILIPNNNLSNQIDNYTTDTLDKKLKFIIIQESKNDENEDVYLLRNSDGYRSELRIKHFKHYGLKVGDEIDCHVYGKNHLGSLKVEPENPYYKTNNSYNFDIESIEDLGEDDFSLVLKDIFGQKCGVQLSKHDLDFLKNKTRAKCRVIGFRKGRPKLTLDNTF